MIILALIVFGLVFGSFVNALVWRVHEQSKNSNKLKLKELSITNGRSMCPNCNHRLTEKDLIPVLSWVILKGKCRYCNKNISIQYPLVELSTALLFVASYYWWPVDIESTQALLFIIWLFLLTGFVALTVYDLRWLLLPNRIVYPLSGFALAFALITILASDRPGVALIETIFAVLIGGGLFYLIFQISKGKWIGGGDVKLGWLLGLIAGTPTRSLLFIFLASILGTIISLPLLASKKLKKSHVIPFGPFLIAGLVITQLFGSEILEWYQNTILNL